MSNIQSIPANSINSTPLGQTLNSFHQGNQDIVQFVEKWKFGSLLPRLRSLETQWNQTIVNIVGGLYRLYLLYNIDLDAPFDGAKIFMNNNSTESSGYWVEFFARPQLVSEGLLDLAFSNATLKDSYDVLKTQTAKVKNFTPKDNFIDFTDTPNSYLGHADKYVGIDANGEAISFLFPFADTNLLQLTDTFNSYPTLKGVVKANNPADALETKDFWDSRSWKIESLPYTGLITNYNLSGTQLDNVLYSMDIGTLVQNTSFIVTMGTTFHGARVAFKCNAGENPSNNKYIHASTGQAVLMESVAPDLHQVVPPKALLFVYSTATTSFYLTQKFEAI